MNRHLPRQVYVREGRRIEGVYLLTEHDGDLASGWERTKVQPTSIAVVEWAYDSHACHRFNPAHPGVREGYTFASHDIFQVPYGVVVPQQINGLLVPVACSATHIAYNALRMEPVFMALGEACGLAAHLAIENQTELRAIPVDRLQHGLVENGGTITYFEDLSPKSHFFPALQWLGARGFNHAYRADAEKPMTQAEGIARLKQVMTQMNLHWTGLTSDNAEHPLRTAEVIDWLRQSGLPLRHETERPKIDALPEVLTCGELAKLIYDSLALG